MATKLTVESINAGIATGAKSLTELGRAMGYQGKIGGSTIKKIKELVPDVMERMANSSAIPHASMPPTPAPQVGFGAFKEHEVDGVKYQQELRKEWEPEQNANPMPVKVVGNPYHRTDAPKNLYAEVFDLGSKAEVKEDEFIKVAGAMLSKSSDTIKAFLAVVKNPDDVRNMGRSKNVAHKDGYLHLQAI